ncbi:MAG: flagellar filament capping protein FliD [Deltaproteobacteria bacterium]|nr:flagellar filament capping protein FliD [Deltaproteobacteria bacterium]
MASNITFSGLSTGLDTASIIEKLMYVERAPERRMQQTQSNYKSQLSILQNVNSRLQALQTKARALDTPGEFSSYTASSSEEEAVTATATGDANPGKYSVEVTQLAQAARNYSTSFASKTEAGLAGAGTLEITVGTNDPVSVDITAEDTLETVVSKINGSGAKVTAGLIYTGSSYRLQVSGKETGAGSTLSFSEGGTLALELHEPSSVYQEARNAAFKVDGYGMTSATNDASDAIPGVTLKLHAGTTGAAEVEVSADPAQMKTKVNDFVAAYNSVVSIISGEFAFTGEAKGAGHLTGDSTLRTLQQQLGSSVSSAVSGLGASASALSEIGVKTNRDGTLTVDAAKLDEALSKDAAGVAGLFAGTSTQSVDGVADRIDHLVDRFINSTTGILTARTTGINRTIADLEDGIASYEDRMARYEDSLIMKFTNLEVTVSSLSSQSSYISQQAANWK